jgi:hypothetical protein
MTDTALTNPFYAGLRNPGTDTSNPKHNVGVTKAPLSLNPPVASIHQSLAHYDGMLKYGPYNWRATPVNARIYLEAAMRHIASYLDGETTATDSGVHHLGHVMACAAIVLDAESLGQLIDDRPVAGKSAELLEYVRAWMIERKGKQ